MCWNSVMMGIDSLDYFSFITRQLYYDYFWRESENWGTGRTSTMKHLLTRWVTCSVSVGVSYLLQSAAYCRTFLQTLAQAFASYDTRLSSSLVEQGICRHSWLRPRAVRERCECVHVVHETFCSDNRRRSRWRLGRKSKIFLPFCDKPSFRPESIQNSVGRDGWHRGGRKPPFLQECSYDRQTIKDRW